MVWLPEKVPDANKNVDVAALAGAVMQHEETTAAAKAEYQAVPIIWIGAASCGLVNAYAAAH
eukprot:5056599-Alexandrium_andersonii.AAC.1